MLKKISMLAAAVLCVCIVGCGNSNTTTHSYKVDTGDSVQVTFNKSDGYKFSSDLPFVISKDGTPLAQGSFISDETYEEYKTVVDNDDAAEILDFGEKEGNEYIFWAYKDTEFNYVMRIGESGTALIMENHISEETAKECFERVSVEIKEK